MADLAHVIRELKSRLGPLGRAAVRWEKALAVEESRSHPVLPLRDDIGEPINLQSVSAACVPDCYHGVVDNDLRKKVQARYWQIALRSACSHPATMRVLSSLAHDAALGRTIISQHDVFHVSGRSVLTAVAMGNCLHMLIRWSRDRDDDIFQNDELRNCVLWPLRAADTYYHAWLPGDLWWMDLATRTLCVAVRKLTRNWQDQEVLKLVGPLFIEFVRRASLFKLLSVDLLGPDLAKFAKYDLWPGMETLESDDAAGSIRNVLCTELCMQLQNDGSGLQKVAFLQMLHALTTPGGDREWPARILVARLFWEFMECDAELVARLSRDRNSDSSVKRAVLFLRDGLRQPAPDGQQHLELRFRDIWASLSAWDEFEDPLQSLNSGLSGVPLRLPK